MPAACCSELWARAPELTTFGRVSGGHPEARAGCVIGVHSEPRDRFYEKKLKFKPYHERTMSREEIPILHKQQNLNMMISHIVTFVINLNEI